MFISSSIHQHAMHCCPKPGVGRAIALFGFEGQYPLGSLQATSLGTIESLVEWTNRDRRTQSGRCRFNLAPQ